MNLKIVEYMWCHCLYYTTRTACGVCDLPHFVFDSCNLSLSKLVCHAKNKLYLHNICGLYLSVFMGVDFLRHSHLLFLLLSLGFASLSVYRKCMSTSFHLPSLKQIEFERIVLVMLNLFIFWRSTSPCCIPIWYMHPLISGHHHSLDCSVSTILRLSVHSGSLHTIGVFWKMFTKGEFPLQHGGLRCSVVLLSSCLFSWT